LGVREKARQRVFYLFFPIITMSLGSKLEESFNRIIDAFTDLIATPLSEFADALGDWFGRSLTSWYSLILITVAIVISFIIWKFGRNIARLLR